MQSGQEARPRARSAFAAAFLSLLFPGLGHAYAGAWQRALLFAALPLLLISLGAGVLLRLPITDLVAFASQEEVLNSVFVLNLLALAYRLVAVVDAYRVTAFLNAWSAGADGRLGQPRLRPGPLSLAGLLAVVLVLGSGHVALARLDLIAIRTLDCIFDSEATDCPTAGSATPSASAPASGSPSPSAEPSAEPSLSLPPEGSAVPDVTSPPWNGTERLNILLIGADEQGGAHNTDTLITVSIDPVGGKVAMFTLPRDAVNVPIPPGPARRVYGNVYAGKINSLFVNAGRRGDAFPGTDRTRGYNALKATLGQLYGLDIKYFVEVNFEGFKAAVDALGGVTVNVQVPVVDDSYPDDKLARRVFIPSGVQHMTGAQALIYARSRHGSSDFDRGQRQQRVLLSLREQIDIGTMLPRIDQLATALQSAVRTDVPRELLPNLVGLVDRIDSREIRTYVFAPPRYGSEQLAPIYMLFPNVQAIRQAVNEAFVVDPELEGLREALAEEAGSVWVLNGSGAENQASNIARYLEFIGLTASAPNRRGEQGAATRIEVYNGAERRIPRTIEALQEAFGVPAQTRTDPGVRVDIVITTGRDTPQLSPPPRP
jgi:LCP family protein required for cell wall assembly